MCCSSSRVIVGRLIVGSIAGLSIAVTVAQAPTTFRLAFYNIRSGQGIEALRGHATPFAATVNCDPKSGAVNAWGVGMVQKELVKAIKNDASVLALGLAEAWNCGSPENVRQVLDWKAHSSERNGVALVARYGFAGQVDWLQLDTSKNKNPRDDVGGSWPGVLDRHVRRQHRRLRRALGRNRSGGASDLRPAGAAVDRVHE